MRRFFSIVALVAIMCPIASPLWASTASSTGAMSCHRTPLHKPSSASAPSVHHCHDMGGMMMTSEHDTGSMMAAYGGSEKCPMNCCLQAAPPTVAALPAASFIPQLHVVEPSIHAFAITFSSVGFSSHTDRGPPSL